MKAWPTKLPMLSALFFNTKLFRKAMNTFNRIFKIATVLVFCIGFAQNTEAQFLKKLGKKAEKAAERAVERRVEKETTKKTEAAMDSILEPGKDGKNTKKPTTKAEKKSESDENSTGVSQKENGNSSASGAGSESIQIYRKFDFVPGDELLFYDDLSNDFIGDFPSKWNTNGSGELTKINEDTNKWLKIVPGYNTNYIPDLTDLPEEFTLEFDVIADGLNNKTSSQAYLKILVGDNNNFNKPKNMGMVEYPLCQFIDPGTIVENNVNGTREIRNAIKVDIRQVVLKKHHISVAVNKQRFRMWINELKLVDIPRLLPANVAMKGIKLQLRGTDINRENIYLSNFKIAKGGSDLRRTLISEGRVSTNGILFNSGSATILPQSMGIIRQISQVLLQETTMNLNIVGHTDSDGDEKANKTLSQRRAEAVRSALIDIYNIPSARLSAEGKGESEPVGDNSTAEGKSKNRRVEFVKQ